MATALRELELLSPLPTSQSTLSAPRPLHRAATLEIFHLITGLFLIIYASHTPSHFHCVSQSTSTLFLFDFLFHFYHCFRAQLTSILSPYRYIQIAIISNTPLMGSIVHVIPSTCRGTHGFIPCSS